MPTVPATTFRRLLELAARMHVDDAPNQRAAYAQHVDGQWIVTVRSDDGDVTYAAVELANSVEFRQLGVDLCAECGETQGDSADEGCASCVAQVVDGIDWGACAEGRTGR